MKLTQILSITIFALTVIACKNETKEAAPADSGKLPETFNITFNLTIPKDDTFQLYYTEDNSLNFGDDRSVKSVVKGGTAPQDVLFKLPVDVLPTNIRLDFGENKEQGDVVVNAMKLKYFDKTFEAKANLVKQYFFYNDFQLKYDEATSTVKAVVGKDGVYDPLMFSAEALKIELSKIVK